MSSKLFEAANNDNLGLYMEGLAEGEDINATNFFGKTSLMVACSKGYHVLASYIMVKGADTSLTDFTGKSAADYAAGSGDETTAALFGNSYSEFSDETGPYKALLNNAYEIIKDIQPLLTAIEYNYRAYLVEDFAKVLLLATRGEDFGTLYKYSFGLMTNFILNENISKEMTTLNALSEVKLTNMFLDMAKGQDSFFKKMETLNYEFSLNSFPIFEDDELILLKKALYEFAEIVVKADGTVTDEEVRNLKALNAKYLSAATTNNDTPVQPERVAEEQEPAQTRAGQSTAAPVSLEKTLEELNALVGLDNIKEDVKTLINIINANKFREKEGLPKLKVSLHSVFMGPPGTGKTTVARMLADIYSALGVLTQNNFVETDRAGLVAGFVGQTAIKTDGVIKKAQNGVLFIDEAYTLKRDDSQEDFGQEAIDIMLKRMEDHRDSLVIIVAGYEDEMNHFIDSNPGLKSRFNRYFYFKDYTPQELTEIYTRVTTKAGFVLTTTALQRLNELFTVLHANKNKQFGNARLAQYIRKNFREAC